MDQVIQIFIEKLKKAGLMNKIEMMYLFGSRARGDERPNSDYDIFIVTPVSNKIEFKSKVYDIVMDILLEKQRLISLKVYRSKDFKRFCMIKTPFITNILKEGVKIG
ncbi:MAG: nucleotidyltransferase domain-containing protein [Candidatus Omnitrophota bacterium]